MGQAGNGGLPCQAPPRSPTFSTSSSSTSKTAPSWSSFTFTLPSGRGLPASGRSWLPVRGTGHSEGVCWQPPGTPQWGQGGSLCHMKDGVSAVPLAHPRRSHPCAPATPSRSHTTPPRLLSAPLSWPVGQQMWRGCGHLPSALSHPLPSSLGLERAGLTCHRATFWTARPPAQGTNPPRTCPQFARWGPPWAQGCRDYQGPATAWGRHKDTVTHRHIHHGHLR